MSGAWAARMVYARHEWLLASSSVNDQAAVPVERLNIIVVCN